MKICENLDFTNLQAELSRLDERLHPNRATRQTRAKIMNSQDHPTGASDMRDGLTISLKLQRTLSVASPIIARISEIIQNRITIVGSAQPFFS